MTYIKGFDTLRGVSIILVLIAHLGLLHLLPDNEFSRERIWRLISGETGVQIFFTLSGFLITKILLEEIDKFRKVYFLKFYIRRFLRLLPPLLVFYFMIATLMVLKKITASGEGFFFSFFYMYNFVPNKFYTGELGHTWSLAVEEQYYLIWPFIISLLNKNKVFIFIFLMLTACIVSVYVYPQWSLTDGFKPMRWFIPAVAPIMIGSFFALLINKRLDIYSVYFKQNNRFIWIGVILFLFPLYTPLLELSFLFQSIGVGILLVWITFNQQSKIIDCLNTKILSYIGKISYGIYVYQGLFLKTSPTGDMWIQKFPQNLILTFAFAILSYHFLEKPILKFKHKFKPTIEKINHEKIH